MMNAFEALRVGVDVCYFIVFLGCLNGVAVGLILGVGPRWGKP